MAILLKKFREEQGVSQAWLAQKMGIHRVTIARYEDGRSTPPQSFYYQLAHLFRFEVEEITSRLNV